MKTNDRIYLISLTTAITLTLIGFATFVVGGNNKNKLKHTPKNVIVMISDGCGYYHVDAASLYQYGQTGTQPYEDFPVVCAMSTYMIAGSYEPNLAWEYFNYVKQGYTDSAAAATAMSTGVKTYSSAIGVDLDKNPLVHILERCEQLGMATGVVTTVPISHATPAGFVAHNVSRNNYEQIAQEMIYRSGCEVIMGCGHPWYDDDGQLRAAPETFKYVGGETTWNELIAGAAGGDADGDGIDDPWTFIQSLQQFQDLESGATPKRVIGVAQVYQTLQQRRSGDPFAKAYDVALIKTVPTLKEITRAALNVLDDDPDGLFLMIEGGAVDWASHDNQSGRLIEEQIDFNLAVEAVIDWVHKNSNWGESLLIMTADHECGYLTGPDSGTTPEGPVWNPLTGNGVGEMPGMQWNSGSHTNSLVPFYAKGRGAKLFKKAAVNTDPVRGPYIDNTDIGKILFGLLQR
jgi:alkaline phosphatase